VAGYVSMFALLKDFLADHGYTKVYRSEPGNLTTAVPVVVVRRFGGADPVVTHDVARLDVDYFASSEDAAEEGAEAIRTLMRTQLHGRIFNGAQVGRVRTMSAPALLPWDASGNVFRFGAAYEVKTHQFSGVS
jgi:hypothetical protein